MVGDKIYLSQANKYGNLSAHMMCFALLNESFRGDTFGCNTCLITSNTDFSLLLFPCSRI